jgi:hypothetical protein
MLIGLQIPKTRVASMRIWIQLFILMWIRVYLFTL